MANFTTIAKVKAVSDIDSENVSGRTFSDDDIQAAMDYGNARILFELKDWTDFYESTYDDYIALMLEQSETCYAAGWLFEQKANQFMNLSVQGEGFSVGDLSISADPAAQKTWYTQYQSLADRYYKMGKSILRRIMPPGTDTVKSTFYFEQCISVEAAEDAEISEE